jgi:hypothetical protein
MVIFRFIVLLLLAGALVSFALYATTGQPRFRRFGVQLLTWAIAAGLGFFAVLLLERMAVVL